MRLTWLICVVPAVAALRCAGADSNAVLWRPPAKVTIQDWIWGPGGQARAPQPPFEFIEEVLNGTNAKIKVRDAKGDQWTVKFGGENHSEVFSSRLLNAMGYVTEPNYFVASGLIAGAHDLKRAKPFIGKDGGFRRARFKLRDHKSLAHAKGRTWSWDDNPFLGTQELNGLKILLMLTSNWDAKDSRDGRGSNTSVYSKPGSADEFIYAFDDWGATMGRWGGFFKRDKWNPAGYQQQTKRFVRATANQIDWGYRGKHGKDITSGISPGDVRWLLTYLSDVTDEELRAGLRASGAREPEIDVYARSLRNRISQLESVSARGESTTAAAVGDR